MRRNILQILIGCLIASAAQSLALDLRQAEEIRLPVRVHRLQSKRESRLHCSLTDDEIRSQFDAVNKTWQAAKIVWEIEWIRNVEAAAPADFTRAMANPRGQLAPALVKNFVDSADRSQTEQSGFDVVIAEDYGKRIGGVFIPKAGLVFYAKHGPKGKQTPAVLAHELGHALGLPHTIFERDNNLMMGSGPDRKPTLVKPITASQVKIARHHACQGKPFAPTRPQPPSRKTNEIYQVLDLDGDGSFTAEEVAAEHRDFAIDFMRRASRAPSDRITRNDFYLIVDHHARQAQNRQHGRRGYGPEIVPQIFSRFDKDKDGQLTRAEANNPQSLVFEKFGAWDTDQNEVLTRQEITAALR